ncbi:hypothetical protein T459_16246 [Capsicum annuum]|uniref:Bet v I/Major latex protein domain-containing protein n=1 Tax=Capsicum annuum TaxID=4072 RepID=A0A2G2Z8A2_CAPAN|nr:hypothetical protein T459_16246 [Capsicum annuum]
MGVKGKLIASMEVKCGGHMFHDIFHTNTHHVPNITPSNISHFQIHEGETLKIGSVVRKYEDGKEMFAKEVIEDFDPQKKSIIWKVIDEDLLELYNSFTVISSCEHQWATFTLAYEKKSEEKPEPLGLLAYFIEVTKDIEGHHKCDKLSRMSSLRNWFLPKSDDLLDRTSQM